MVIIVINKRQKQNNKLNFRRVIIQLCPLFFLFSLPTLLHAQQPGNDFASLDRNMRLYYLANDWDSVIITGKNGLKSGEDYFFLRLRLGIAYYKTGNYCKAAYHLEKANLFNTNDETVLEFLYYSYLLMNRKNEARALSVKFSSRLAAKLATNKSPVFNRFYFETGPSVSNNIEKNKQKNLAGNDSIYGEQDLNGNMYYLHAGTGLNLSKKVSLYLGYGYLTIAKLKQIQTSELVNPGNNSFSSVKGYDVGTVYKKKTDPYSDNYTLYQHEFYSNVTLVLGRGYIVTPAFHLLDVHFNTIYGDLLSQDFNLQSTDTVYNAETRFINYIIAASVNKSLSLYSLGISASFSNLNYKNQYQLGGSFSVFPMGNLNLYSSSTLTFAYESPNKRLVFDQLIGAKVWPKLWIEGFVTIGDMINYNEKNAFVVFNSGDIIRFRAGANVIVPLTKHLEFSLRYYFYNMQGNWLRINADYEKTTTTFAYQNNTFIGGIQWKL